MSWIESLLSEPSPDPAIISPFGNWPNAEIPKENNLLKGPSLLNKALSIEISKISPVVVPQNAYSSFLSIIAHVKILLIFPKFTSRLLIYIF